ncbi:MAG: hypothetical protein J4F97_02360 [Pseudomonadales bacterium]|nr:hypothetical protein [Pseudomonadales bacterium]
MSTRAGNTEMDPIHRTNFPVLITTMTGCRNFSGGRHVQTNSTELLTGSQVVLLVEDGSAVRKRTIEALTVNPDTFANLEGDA